VNADGAIVVRGDENGAWVDDVASVTVGEKT
jgi:hypothetical protein